MDMSLKVEGLSVIVTGANRGIGLEFVKQLVGRKCSVIATARSLEKSEQLLRVSETKGNVKVMELDVTSTDSIESFANQCKDVKVDLLINNAGVLGEDSFETVTREDMRFCFEANTLGPLFVSQALYKAGALKNGSAIANISSIIGSIENKQSGGRYAYAASKGALNIVNKTMALDLVEQGISCIVLHPGYVRTDMTGNSGFVNTDQCVSGMLQVLESAPIGELSGRWFDFAGREVAW